MSFVGVSGTEMEKSKFEVLEGKELNLVLGRRGGLGYYVKQCHLEIARLQGLTS